MGLLTFINLKYVKYIFLSMSGDCFKFSVLSISFTYSVFFMIRCSFVLHHFYSKLLVF